MNASGHLLLPKQEFNNIIRGDIERQYIHITWIAPIRGLKPKMALYAEHFMELKGDLIVWPPCMVQHWMHGLRIRLGQFLLGSHHIQVEIEFQIPG